MPRAKSLQLAFVLVCTVWWQQKLVWSNPWITSDDNVTLLANYAPWLIALGASALCLHEIRCGALLRAEAA